MLKTFADLEADQGVHIVPLEQPIPCSQIQQISGRIAGILPIFNCRSSNSRWEILLSRAISCCSGQLIFDVIKSDPCSHKDHD